MAKAACLRVSLDFERTLFAPTVEVVEAGFSGFAAAKQKAIDMLWTIAVILLILWALGMVSSYTLGGFIHLLLLLAIIVVLIRVIQGRSPVV